MLKKFKYAFLNIKEEKMGYTNRTWNNRRMLPIGIVAVILGLVILSMAAPSTSLAATIACGQCHSIPPQDSDSKGCKQTAKGHPSHADNENDCNRCHPTPGSNAPGATHINNIINITSVMAPGLRYNSANSTCTNACHKNEPTPTWGGTGDCNLCHFRNGATGGYTMSGLHVTNDRTWKHYSSVIKVNGQLISCNKCHPNNDNDTGSKKTHIQTPGFAQKADMSQAHTYVNVTGIGYNKTDESCAKSCHYNPTEPFGNYTIYFKPGQKMRFGPYQTARWSDSDLKCNECHSTPGQSATFGATSSAWANKRHEAHMFRYKLNPYNFQGQDRNIYCDDCHRTPNITATRGFHNHSTNGEGGSRVISLPVKSQNAKVYLKWRNNGIGRDGKTAPSFNSADASCNNIYCHTIMTTGYWAEQGCDACHGTKDGVDVGSGAPGFTNLTSPGANLFEDYSGGGGGHYSHVMKRGYPCRTCHYDGGGDGNPANHHDVSVVVSRANVNVGVQPQYWFNNKTSYYDPQTRSCNNVRCHYGSSQNWDCTPLH